MVEYEDREKIALETFQKKVRDLRASNDFDNLLDDIKNELNLPDNTTLIEMSALLIKATKECYGETIKADAALMALGLLEGYNNREETQGGFYKGGDLLTKRREKFLSEGIYPDIKWSYSYKNIKAGKALNNNGNVLTLKGARSTLGTDDGTYLDGVAKKIYSGNNANQFLEYIRTHEKEYFVFEQEVKKLKLPQLENRRQSDDIVLELLSSIDVSTTLQKESESSDGMQETKTLIPENGDEKEKTEKNESRINFNRQRIVIYILIIVLIVLAFFIGINTGMIIMTILLRK